MNPGPVVTGQQIGLLSGPCYTPYKVLSAVRLARDEGREAIYWLETNDADFQEISTVHYIDRQGTLKQLRWPHHTEGRSCGNILIDRSLCELLDAFFNDLTQTEYTASLRDLALGIYREGRELGSAALELAQVLFPFDNLRFFDPREEEFRIFSRRLLLPLCEQTAPGAQCPGFIDDHGIRRAIFRGNGVYTLRDGRPLDIAEYPLLPNVVTRPLCQDAYFNSSAYIAGPGEMDYLGPLSDFYHQNGVTQPRLIPRMSLTLIEPWTKRQLLKLGLDVEGLLKMGWDAARQDLVCRLEGIDLKEIERDSTEICRRFMEELKHLHPAFSGLRIPVSKEIKQIIGQIRKQNRERSADGLDRLRKVFDRLLPNGRHQERVLSPFYYMNLYGGTKLIQTIFERVDPKLNFLELS